jgi:hypothetical protein
MPRAFPVSLNLLAIVSLYLAGGCATTRTVTITARPADALIKIDGVDRGRGPVTENFTFTDASAVHRVQAVRLGFKDQTVNLTRDFDKETLLIDLKPQTKRVTFNVAPVGGMVYVDGKPLAADPVISTSAELEFTVDAQNRWTTHTVRAERPGFVAAETVVNWADRETAYTLRLEPMRKNVSITTNPPGAQLFIDGQEVGKSPLVVADRPFRFDVDKNEFAKQTIKAVKPGFDPIEQEISWDDGRTDYVVDLQPKSKIVRITTDPPGGVVTIDGKDLPRDSTGATSVKLIFPPTNESGELKTWLATIKRKTETSEWYPASINIGWDGGQTAYNVALKEILTMPVPLVKTTMSRGDDGWRMIGRRIDTIAAKDVTEGASNEPPTQITQLPRGTQIDSLTLSPDGSRLLFTILGGAGDDLRSHLAVVRTDGSGGVDFLSDGKSLDLMPAFSPGGEAIIFSSNRAGRRLSIWTMSAVGAPGITSLTSGETNDLWPNLDSEPKPRLFYQSMIDTRADPRIFSTQLGTVSRTDLTPLGGMQPRVSPKGDTILFSAVNEKTGKRDLYRMSDRGGAAQNLTNTPDVDEFDAVWNKDGSRIAFVSDRAVDEDNRRQLDIWVMDPGRPDQPTQVTTNASHDDSPAWDESGRTIYYRSNRGGDWNVWRIAVR